MKTKNSVKTKKTTQKESNLEDVLLVGQTLPKFTLEGTAGEIASRDLSGQVTVLYFYPKDATPGCTQEGHDFSALKAQFKKAGAQVFGISRDTLASHEKFKAKQNYSIDLLSDADEVACNAFGVIKMKNMYGKKVRGIERSTFVVGRDGRVVKEWRKVKVAGHAEEVLEFVRSLT